MSGKVSKIASKRSAASKAQAKGSAAEKEAQPVARDTREDSIGSDEVNANVKGSKLLMWLLQEARRRNMKFRDLAKELGISRSYLFSLRYGQRKVETLSPDILENCAKFLNVPVISVQMAAEVVKTSDFFASTPTQLASEVNRGIEWMSGDPKWGAWMPDLRERPLDEKLFVVMLYEAASGKTLLETKIDISKLIENFQARDRDA